MARASDDDSADEVMKQVARDPLKAKSYGSVSKQKRGNRTSNSVSKPKTGAKEEDDAREATEAEEDTSNKEESEVEEFEIESILDVAVGKVVDFPDEIAYKVRWKGYTKEDDSWSTETDAQGAKDVIDQFWDKRDRDNKPSREEMLDRHAQKKSGKRKSIGTPSNKRLQSGSSEDLGASIIKDRSRGKVSKSPAVTTSSKGKRGRDSTNGIIPDDVEGGEDSKPSAKKTKVSSTKSVTNRLNGGKKRAPILTESSDDDDDQMETPEAIHQGILKNTMRVYGKEKNWERLVSRISTVERVEEGKDGLQIYWQSTDKIDCLSPSTVFGKRAPQQLIKFYESNLRWRPSVESNSTPPPGEVDNIQASTTPTGGQKDDVMEE